MKNPLEELKKTQKEKGQRTKRGNPFESWENLNSFLQSMAKKSNLPQVEQETAVDETLILYLESWKDHQDVRSPFAWCKTILGRKLGEKRILKLAILKKSLNKDNGQRNKTHPSQDFKTLFWKKITKSEAVLKTLLTPIQWKVLCELKDSRSIKSSAKSLKMTPRDLRNHLKGIENKLIFFFSK